MNRQFKISHMALKDKCVAVAFTAAALCIMQAAPSFASPPVVSIYIVEHGLVDTSEVPFSLNGAGIQHRDAVRDVFVNIPLTNVFSSHTLRSMQTVEAAAAEHSLDVLQLPQPGSRQRMRVSGLAMSKQFGTSLYVNTVLTR